jgi:hypothetical protein
MLGEQEKKKEYKNKLKDELIFNKSTDIEMINDKELIN